MRTEQQILASIEKLLIRGEKRLERMKKNITEGIFINEKAIKTHNETVEKLGKPEWKVK